MEIDQERRLEKALHLFELHADDGGSDRGERDEEDDDDGTYLFLSYTNFTTVYRVL